MTENLIITNASDLQDAVIGCRLERRQFGIKRKISEDSRRAAADATGVDESRLSAAVAKIDTRHPAYKEVTSTLTSMRQLWITATLPFVDGKGLRLVPKHRIQYLNDSLAAALDDLRDALESLQQHWHELREQARIDLGPEFNPLDYPSDIRGAFAAEWSFCTVEPPSYLMQIDPDLYEQERVRIAAKFEASLELAEQAFAVELQRLLDHLIERLQPSENGKKKKFHDSSIENLKEFLSHFKSMNIRSNPALDELMRQTELLIQGVDPSDIRSATENVKAGFTTQLSAVSDRITKNIIDKPTRKITFTDDD